MHLSSLRVAKFQFSYTISKSTFRKGYIFNRSPLLSCGYIREICKILQLCQDFVELANYGKDWVMPSVAVWACAQTIAQPSNGLHTSLCSLHSNEQSSIVHFSSMQCNWVSSFVCYNHSAQTIPQVWNSPFHIFDSFKQCVTTHVFFSQSLRAERELEESRQKRMIMTMMRRNVVMPVIEVHISTSLTRLDGALDVKLWMDQKMGPFSYLNPN